MSLAENYEKFLVPIIMDRWAKMMAGIVTQGDHVLDVGCGTGIVSRYAAGIAGGRGRVVGLDMSQDMLRVARLVMPPYEGTAAWVIADATAMPFDAPRFDVVLCQFSVMFMENKAAALREMRRVLKPEGGFRVSVFASGPYDQALREALVKHAAPEEKDFAIWSCSNSDRLCSLIAGAGFEIIALKKEATPSCYTSVRQSVALMKDWSKTVAELSGNAFEQVCRDLELALSDYITADGFACPEPVTIITARPKK